MKSITVLKLKLAVDDETQQQMRVVASHCRHARNAAVEDWLLRQRGKPETAKQSQRLCKHVKHEGKPKSESTKLYHAITAAVPELGTTNASMIASAIASHLSAKVDWRRGKDESGRTPKRKDAILAYEDRIPFFTGDCIPVRSKDSVITVRDGQWSLTVRRPLRDMHWLAVDIASRGLPPRIKSILADISTGARKFADSQVLLTSKGWQWHLPVAFERDQLDETIEAHLWPTIPSETARRQSDRPFSLVLPNQQRPWYIGDGRYLLAQTERLVGLKKQIGWRYRQGMGAGHGRQKIDAAVRRRSQQLDNIRAEVRRRAIADIVSQCVRAKCGKLVYHEPTNPAKDRLWFAAVKLDWDWTRFGADLKNAAARKGVEVVIVKLKIKEVIGAA